MIPQEYDWLDSEAQAASKEQQLSKALEIARLHQVFITNPAAKQLLDLWKRAANQRVPVNATIDQYARAEAIRSFVQTIEDQINFAVHDGRTATPK